MATLPEFAQVSYVDKETNEVQNKRSLMDPIPFLDARDTLKIPPSKRNPYGALVTARNHVSIFDAPFTATSSQAFSTRDSPTYALPARIVKELYQSILISRTVKQQTGKGKIMRKYFLVCAGNGNGLVGYGEGKDFNARLALQKARIQAIKNMDYVERFEERTLWTDMESKLGATRLIIRPRPVGFGLRCNPFLHQILRAAGFKDVSAKVWGSRNKLNVIKAAFNLIHAGHAPPGMGDGVGGKGIRLSKGVGMRGKTELERARGRKLISLRK
jgi:small subunit ribosomal protein S5